MITINISVTSDVTGNVYNREIQIGDQDIVRILAAMNNLYLGDTTAPPVEELMQKTTEVFDRVVDTFWGTIKTATRDYEIAQAQAALVAAIAPLEDLNQPAPEPTPEPTPEPAPTKELLADRPAPVIEI